MSSEREKRLKKQIFLFRFKNISSTVYFSNEVTGSPLNNL